MRRLIIVVVLMFMQSIFFGCFTDMVDKTGKRNNMLTGALLLFLSPVTSLTPGSATDGSSSTSGGSTVPENTNVPVISYDQNVSIKYYVDFDAGQDTNNGTSTSSAWKHCPGDSNATGVASSTTLVPGDVVAFKGGVYYRGSITVKSSGSSGKQIQYRGDQWGSSAAILDGSKPLTGWTQCASAKECGGNANYANIYYANIPASDYIGISYCNLHELDDALYVAQYPNPSDRFYWNDVNTLGTVPSPVSNATRTSITDSKVFTQSDSTYWNGSSIAIWYQPNLVKVTPILSYTPSSNKITFADTNVYTDRATKYAIYNSIHEIDQVGEYYVNLTAESDGTHKVYLWPHDPANLKSGISISTRKFGFDVSSRNYVTIGGFVIQKYTGSGLRDGIAVGTYQGSTVALTGLVIKNNYIRHNCGPTSGGYGGIYLAGAAGSRLTNTLIDGNAFYENGTQFGIFLSYADGHIISNNTITRSGYTDIVMFYCTTTQIIKNTIVDGRGPHANGITVYLQCSQILVAWNKIMMNEYPITFNENYGGIYFYRNLIDARSSASQLGVNEWGSGASDYKASNIWFINNTFVRSSNHNSCNIGTKPSNSYLSRNNIFDGGADNSTHTVDRDYNLYVGLLWDQDPNYGWYANTHEVVNTDPADTFVDFTSSAGDLHLKDGSVAIGAGTDVSSNIATMEKLFPGVDFMVDLDGVTVPSNNRDLGAYIWQ